MFVIQVLDKSFDIFIPKDEIERKVQVIASSINADYKGTEVVFIAVLNGAFMFSSDLLKNIDLECEITFVKMSSYQGTRTTGKVEELIGLTTDIEGKELIIIEDIVDTGYTIDKIISLLKDKKPKSVKICTLLYKPDAFKGNSEPEYVGFSIPNAFVVGYGLDYDQKGRNLDALYQIRESKQ
ncbi:MAG: hypoxanthine phosphoribosyltransferase [Crocinitomicaceae bacterium]|nr:hypoxanthine phosphoribosyltransferase [Crocinitomicaceae bacterium]